jgi:hypothetical protein
MEDRSAALHRGHAAVHTEADTTRVLARTCATGNMTVLIDGDVTTGPSHISSTARDVRYSSKRLMSMRASATPAVRLWAHPVRT